MCVPEGELWYFSSCAENSYIYFINFDDKPSSSVVL